LMRSRLALMFAYSPGFISALPSFERRFGAFAIFGLGGYPTHTRAK
jgi:hypothetical protein